MIAMRRGPIWLLALVLSMWLVGCSLYSAANQSGETVSLPATAVPTARPAPTATETAAPIEGSEADALAFTILHINDVRGAIYPCG